MTDLGALDDHALIDELADALAARLQDRLGRPAPSAWLTAAEKARQLGVAVDYVYRHALELGGERLGDGPRGRWRFPATMPTTRVGDRGSAPPDAPRRRRSRARRRADRPLLPIRRLNDAHTT
jgi:hypothetical protein